MRSRPFLRAVVWAISSFCFFISARAVQPEGQLAQTVKQILSKTFTPDWQGIEKLSGIQWAPLPPTMLTNCLPDGGCFTRQGTLVLGDRKFLVLASGARTIVSHIYFRNATAPISEPAVVAALKQSRFAIELVRCPVSNTIGGTNWYRLKAPSAEPATSPFRPHATAALAKASSYRLEQTCPRSNPLSSVSTRRAAPPPTPALANQYQHPCRQSSWRMSL
jgi:hypothetical protein